MTSNTVMSATTSVTHQTGPVARQGTDHGYRQLVAGPGEPHVVRADLVDGADKAPTAGGASLAHFTHITDVQLIDHQSPGRLECLHSRAHDPRTDGLIPMVRPQETMGTHATEALIRAVNAAGPSEVTGQPLQLAISTGDSIDNAQHNELQNFLALMNGGLVTPDSGGPAYEGVADGRFDWTWAPEVADHAYAKAFGFPTVEGLLDAVREPFRAEGLNTGWLSAFGNHDGEIQGRSPVTAELAALLTGDRKVVAAPEGRLPDVATDFSDFFTGAAYAITPDAARRPILRQDYVAAHRADGGRPTGHGFTAENAEQGTAYYAYDGIEGLRIIMLDTTNTDGYANGSIGTKQLAWLHERLAEVNPRHLDSDGDWVTGGDDDRLVIIASHHSRNLMDNPYMAAAPDDPAGSDGPRFTGEVLHAALQQYPNVIAWISGHIHKHLVEPRPGPAGGFWEITTCSVLEWPSQARMIEVIDREDGTLSLRCTVIDHAGPTRPGGIGSVLDLASWHRELSANDLTGVQGLAGSGRTLDRNVDLRIVDPRRR